MRCGAQRLVVVQVQEDRRSSTRRGLQAQSLTRTRSGTLYSDQRSTVKPHAGMLCDPSCRISYILAARLLWYSLLTILYTVHHLLRGIDIIQYRYSFLMGHVKRANGHRQTAHRAHTVRIRYIGKTSTVGCSRAYMYPARRVLEKLTGNCTREGRRRCVRADGGVRFDGG